MNELSYYCNLYLKVGKEKTLAEATSRIETLLDSVGIEYCLYESELRNEEGLLVEAE